MLSPLLHMLIDSRKDTWVDEDGKIAKCKTMLCGRGWLNVDGNRYLSIC